MALTRKDKIIALLLPASSDLSDTREDEEFPGKLFDMIRDSNSESSEAPSIPDEAVAVMEDIMNDLSNTNDASPDEVTPEKVSLCAFSTPRTSFAITPLKTRSHSKTGKKRKNVSHAVRDKLIKDEVSRKMRKVKKKKLECSWTNEQFAFPVDIPEENFTTLTNAR
ncbi:unnamed protein product [Acanthoscelides obtectus]|uniref:Uncharacterized protein n=1 Tax=Acanthoscelides obtectus TaxID=200917 RepID=A0A9P0PA13_ACAOB|nr:unnamed protein product [Acanthoscelides obtectus]CAK1653708.1 hypothetical protein AOBTE_LOCUS18337 [Acanthoscelides obtectus]